MKFNYKVNWISWMESSVEKTTDEVDNVEVFKTYTEAKKSLLKSLTSLRSEISSHIYLVKTIKKNEIL